MTATVGVKSPGSMDVIVERKVTPPAQLWAYLGALLLAGEVYLVVKWVTGPYFAHVSTGPSVPPTWMKIAINSVEVVSVLGFLVWMYVFLVRPWRQSRQVTFMGQFSVALMLTSLYDPLSNYFQTWFTYNSYFVNRGNALSGIPGWVSYGRPGAMVAWPAILVPTAYPWLLGGLGLIGAWVMKKAAARWPRRSGLFLIAVCFVFMMVVDFLIEGMGALRLGFWAYSGGPFALNPSHFYKFPLNELFIAAAVFTAPASFIYFKNDHGQSIAERGLDRVDRRRRGVVQFLAVFAVTQMILLVFFHLPSAVVSMNQSAWPKDVQDRSYLTNHVCGAGTDRACPGPSIPASRPGSAYVSPSGGLVVPAHTSIPGLVPFK